MEAGFKLQKYIKSYTFVKKKANAKLKQQVYRNIVTR